MFKDVISGVSIAGSEGEAFTPPPQPGRPGGWPSQSCCSMAGGQGNANLDQHRLSLQSGLRASQGSDPTTGAPGESCRTRRPHHPRPTCIPPVPTLPLACPTWPALAPTMPNATPMIDEEVATTDGAGWPQGGDPFSWLLTTAASARPFLVLERQCSKDPGEPHLATLGDHEGPRKKKGFV